MKLAIVGSRDFLDYAKFKEVMTEWIKKHKKPHCIISGGGCRGPDAMAITYAQEEDIKYKVHPAEWNKYGLSAGPKRNTLIIQEADHVIAFPSLTSRGTLDSIRKAQLKRIPVEVHFITL